MTRYFGPRQYVAWRRPKVVRLDRDSVTDVWLSLCALRRSADVFVVAGHTSMRLSLTPPKAAPFDVVGRFTHAIMRDELESEARHTAEELAATLNMQVAA